MCIRDRLERASAQLIEEKGIAKNVEVTIKAVTQAIDDPESVVVINRSKKGK